MKAFCSCCLMDLSAREQNSTIINRTSSYVILKENPPLICTKKAIVPNAFLRRIDSSDSNTGAFYTRVHQHLRRYIYVYFKVYHQAITFFILKQQHYGPKTISSNPTDYVSENDGLFAHNHKYWLTFN